MWPFGRGFIAAAAYTWRVAVLRWRHEHNASTVGWKSIHNVNENHNHPVSISEMMKGLAESTEPSFSDSLALISEMVNAPLPGLSTPESLRNVKRQHITWSHSPPCSIEFERPPAKWRFSEGERRYYMLRSIVNSSCIHSYLRCSSNRRSRYKVIIFQLNSLSEIRNLPDNKINTINK